MTTPTILYDEDGHPLWISTTIASTAKQAVRIQFENAYEGAVVDYLTAGSGKPMLSLYRSYVDEIKRVWVRPRPLVYRLYDSETRWDKCKGATVQGDLEFWEMQK